MRLTGLELKKVACFEDAKFVFPKGKDDTKADAYLFVGPNGSGKTTALMALGQLFTHQGTGLGPRVRADGYVTATYADGKDSGLATFRAVGSLPSGQRGFPILEISQVHTPAFGAFAYTGRRSTGAGSVHSIVELQGHPLAGSLDFSTGHDERAFVQWVANTYAKEAFAMRSGDEARRLARRAALSRIESTVAAITDAKFELVLHDDPISVRCRYQGVELHLDLLPDGLKSILSWVGDILMRIDRTQWVDDGVAPLDREHLIFLDEVEVHLHPKWQRKVLPAVQSLFPKSQIFLTTHSPFVVASATDAFIYKLDRGTVSEPIPTNEADSISTILDSILGVSEEFSDVIQEQLKAFQAACNEARVGNGDARTRAQQLGATLGAKGPELAVIVHHQLRMLDARKQSA